MTGDVAADNAAAMGLDIGAVSERVSVHLEIGQLGRDQGVRKILPQASG
jgi:hypothetical protein